jgi:hypothetical protein
LNQLTLTLFLFLFLFLFLLGASFWDQTDAMADGPDGPVRQDVSDQDMDKPPPRKLSGDGYDAPEMTATKTEEKQGTENIPVEVEVVVDASPL